MTRMENILFLIYILPGFVIYQFIKELVYLKEKDSFEKTIWALFFSLLSYLLAGVLSECLIITDINSLSVLFILNLLIAIIIIVGLSVFYLKIIHYKVIKLTQILDIVKYNQKEIFIDTQSDIKIEYSEFIKTHGIWLKIG